MHYAHHERGQTGEKIEKSQRKVIQSFRRTDEIVRGGHPLNRFFDTYPRHSIFCSKPTNYANRITDFSIHFAFSSQNSRIPR